MGSATRYRLVLLGLMAWRLFAPAGLYADGTQTGIIAGEVVDSTGVGLPGVEVAVSGPQLRRSAVSDSQGRFRFPSLGLGAYQVTAELLGLKTSAADIQVFLGKTTEVRLQLREGPSEGQRPEVKDWIEVIAEAPLIDKYDSRVGASVTADFLDDLPVQRFYQSVAEVLPGISGGQDGNPNVSGALRDANLFLVDGVDTTDPTTGLFGLNLNYEAIQEVHVATAALPAEYGRASGAVINVVTRSGGNDYRGSLRWLATNNSRNGRYRPAPPEAAYLTPAIDAANAGPDRINQTVALAAGGPVKPDHLWFFAAYDDAGSAFLAPTAMEGVRWDQGAALESGAAKATAQLGRKNTFILQYTRDSARFASFTPFNRSATENRVAPRPTPLRGSDVGDVPGDLFALQDQSQEGDFSKLQWNGAVSQNLSFEVILAQQSRRLTEGALNSRGVTGDAPHLAITEFERDAAGGINILGAVVHNGITDNGFERRPRRQGNLAADWFFQAGATDHEIKAGVDYQRTVSERRFNFAGQRGTDPSTGRSVEGQIFFDLDPHCPPGETCTSFDPATGRFAPLWLFNFWSRAARKTSEETTALYLSDAIAAGRWLLTAGARFETTRARDETGKPLIDDRSIAPRIGLTYDPRGDGKALFSVFYGRYFEPFLQQFLDAIVNDDAFSGFSFYTWDAAAAASCGDAGNPASPCWVSGFVNDFSRVQPASISPSLRSSSVDEMVVGFERQLTATTGVSLHYVDRRWHRLWDNVITGALDENGQIVFDSSEIRNLPQARRRYRAIQLLVQKRYSDHWQFLGSYTHSKAEGNLFQNDAFATFADYSNLTDVNLVNRFGLAPYDRTHQFKLFANLQVPFTRANLSLGTAMRYESGVPYQLEEGDPRGIGVRFLTPRGSLRLPQVFQLDLSLGAQLRLGQQFAFQVRAEVFNLTNQRQVLGVETRRDFGNAGQPRTLADFQAPRNYRLTLGLRF